MTIEKQLKKLSQGDVAAFDYLYEQTRKTVFYIALSIVKERSLAEDVMQSAYLNIIKSAATYRTGTDVLAWIARIARNEALNVKKKRDREVYVDEQLNPDIFGAEQTDDYGLLIDLARKTLEADEFYILMLAASGGYKRREISAMLDMPVSTVSYKYKTAIEKLRNVLENQQ